MFLERFKEVENFTTTKLPLGRRKRQTQGKIFWVIKVNHDYPHSTCRIIILKRNQLKIRATVIIHSAHINIVNEFMQKCSILHL